MGSSGINAEYMGDRNKRNESNNEKETATRGSREKEENQRRQETATKETATRGRERTNHVDRQPSQDYEQPPMRNDNRRVRQLLARTSPDRANHADRAAKSTTKSRGKKKKKKKKKKMKIPRQSSEERAASGVDSIAPQN